MDLRIRAIKNTLPVSRRGDRMDRSLAGGRLFESRLILLRQYGKIDKQMENICSNR